MKNNTEDMDVKIAMAMIESYHPEDNAYNHGLAHAGLLFNGVSVEAIKEMQNRMRSSIK
jgi:putative NIF3 family GTP cyclohydrolase 1 type 2